MNDNQIQSAPSNKTAVMLGVLFSVIITLELVISYTMHIGTDSAFGIIIFVMNYLVLPAVFISMACSAYKKANGGFITFSECLKTGVIVCVVAGVIAAFAGVIMNMLYPDYMTEIMDQARTKMLTDNPDMTEKQAEMGISMMEKFSKPWFTIPVTIIIYALVGLLQSLVIGAIVKKDRPVSF